MLHMCALRLWLVIAIPFLFRKKAKRLEVHRPLLQQSLLKQEQVSTFLKLLLFLGMLRKDTI